MLEFCSGQAEYDTSLLFIRQFHSVLVGIEIMSSNYIQLDDCKSCPCA
jgi:hypothetical protein